MTVTKFKPEDAVADFLAHHGVKGQKWGRRRVATTSTGATSKLTDPKVKTRSAKRQAKYDLKGESLMAVNKHAFKGMQALASAPGGPIRKLSLNPKYASKNLNANPELKARYDRKVLSIMQKSLNQSTSEFYSSQVLYNSKLKRYEVRTTRTAGKEIAKQAFLPKPPRPIDILKKGGSEARGNLLDIGLQLLQSDMKESESFTFDFVRDKLGHVIGVTAKLAHEDPVDDFLAHFGIKGMRWGIRRPDGPAGTVSSNPAVKTTSDDADRAGSTLHTIKKGGTAAVSNSELQHLIQRMNLEKQFADFNAAKEKAKVSKTARVNSAIKTALKYGGTANNLIQFANSDAGRLMSQSLRLAKSGGSHAIEPKGIIPKSVLPALQGVNKKAKKKKK